MRTVCTLSVLLMLVFSVQLVGAQDEDYTLRHQDVDGEADVEGLEVDDTVTMYVMCDFEDGGDMQGYQWGVCHDGTGLTLADGDVVNGSYTDDSDDGGPAVSFTFEAVTVIDDDDEELWGWTVGSLLNVITGDVITPADDAEMYSATYTADADGDWDLTFCETLGSPVVTVRVIVDSEEIEPVQETSTLSVGDGGGGGGFTYAMGDEDGTLEDLTVTDTEFGVTFYVGGDDSTETQGFQMSIAYDTDFMSAVEEDDDADYLEDALADLDDGDGPAFFGLNLDPDFGGGMTLGCVYDLFGDIVLVFGDATAVFTVNFDADGAADMDTTDISYEDGLGDPPLVNQVVVDGDGVATENTDMTVTFDLGPGDDPVVVLGDTDGDGVLGIEDVFDVIDFLWQSGPDICEDGIAQLDDPTDVLDNADIIFLLNYIFLDGPEPPGDFPDCDAATDCDVSGFCA